MSAKISGQDYDIATLVAIRQVLFARFTSVNGHHTMSKLQA